VWLHHSVNGNEAAIYDLASQVPASNYCDITTAYHTPALGARFLLLPSYHSTAARQPQRMLYTKRPRKTYGWAGRLRFSIDVIHIYHCTTGVGGFFLFLGIGGRQCCMHVLAYLGPGMGCLPFINGAVCTGWEIAWVLGRATEACERRIYAIG